MSEMYHIGECLQGLASNRESGKLVLVKGLLVGNIFLDEGRIIHAETNQEQMGLPALWAFLRNEEMNCTWDPGVQPKDNFTSLNIEVEQMLVGFFLDQQDDVLKEEGAQELLIESCETTGIQKVVDFKNCAISLAVKSGSKNGETFYIQHSRTRVGRASSCEIIIPDVTISVHHCVFTMDKHLLKVTDLGSTNGIEVNGERGLEFGIHSGDEIKLGSVLCEIQFKVKRSARITQTVSKVYTESDDDKKKYSETAPLRGAALSWKDLPQKQRSVSVFKKLF
ncbi:MAG: FHA domain-containing protein [Verrucomicrobiota bacterium]